MLSSKRTSLSRFDGLLVLVSMAEKGLKGFAGGFKRLAKGSEYGGRGCTQSGLRPLCCNDEVSELYSPRRKSS